MLTETDPTVTPSCGLHADELLNRPARTPQVTIAASDGDTAGGGLEVATACELRLGRTGAGTWTRVQAAPAR